MSLELTLLQLLKSRDKYEKLYRAVPKAALDVKTETILDDYGKYFREFTDVKVIDFENFWLWFRSFAHPKLSTESMAFYETLLRKIDGNVPPEIESGLSHRLVAANAAANVLVMMEKYNQGEEIDLLSSLKGVVEQFELDTDRKVKTPWVQDDIDDLLADDANDKGFHWRLDQLNECMRPLRPGDFGLMAARPDKGKTTFCCDQLTHFAPQVDLLFPGEDRYILWFNNEGPGNRIVKRLYQSALYASGSDLVARSQAGTIREDYRKAVGGRADIIRVFDIHDFWNHEVEDIIRVTPPALIVFDMVDNIKFGGSANNNGQRTDQLLEAMYQWSRIIGVKHDCTVLANSQVSADGENLAYPTLSMLKDSKTGKQGAADFILTIGALDDFPSSRYLGLTKNKLAREGGPKSPKIEVVFDSDRGRYVTPGSYNGAA